MVDPQRNNTVQTFPPQRADEPLAERISLWTLGRRLEDLESQGACQKRLGGNFTHR